MNEKWKQKLYQVILLQLNILRMLRNLLVMVKLKHISPNPLLYMVLGQNQRNTKPAQDLEGRVNEARAITPEDFQELNVMKQKQRC